MENASKALLMAAGVVIGVLVLSLAVFLFTDFGAKSKKIYDEIDAHKLTEYNAQYTVFSGRTDINIYEIISVANLARENNLKNSDEAVSVYLTGVINGVLKLHEKDRDFLIEIINNINNIDHNSTFKCNIDGKAITYYPNGKVKSILFSKN